MKPHTKVTKAAKERGRKDLCVLCVRKNSEAGRAVLPRRLGNIWVLPPQRPAVFSLTRFKASNAGDNNCPHGSGCR